MTGGGRTHRRLSSTGPAGPDLFIRPDLMLRGGQHDALYRLQRAIHRARCQRTSTGSLCTTVFAVRLACVLSPLRPASHAAAKPATLPFCAHGDAGQMVVFDQRVGRALRYVVQQVRSLGETLEDAGAW